VGTITEVYDYLRLLFARVGRPLCPQHQIPVESTTPQQIIEDVFRHSKGTKFYVLAPMAQGKKGEFLAEFQRWAKKGFVKAKVDGVFVDLNSAKKLAKTKLHDIDLVVDQLVLKDQLSERLASSVHLALSLAQGRIVIETTTGQRKSYSLHSSCPECGFSFPLLEPRFFSFNNPRGSCPECKGLGTTDFVEEEIFNESDSGGRKLREVKIHFKGSPALDLEDSSEELADISICSSCQGRRLRSEALQVFIQEKNIFDLGEMSTSELSVFFKNLSLKDRESKIADKIIQQILFRLKFIERVGAGYLSMNRAARTLSGGEAQRIRLATQVGSGLIGILYVMDEPSIGLHPRDHHRLLEIIGELRDRGNTIALVEHDEDTIRFADHVVDIGPGAGKTGGSLLFSGSPRDLEKNQISLTGQYLSGKKNIPRPLKRRPLRGDGIRLVGASGNNLKNVNVNIPFGLLTVVTGVSGSGKSTLIIDTLCRIVAREKQGSSLVPSPYKKIIGLDQIDKMIDINQKPIGRTPRSTPATYVGLFPLIRDLYAQLPESKMRGYGPGHFSFNVKGGRCENCQGHGSIRLEMHFLSDVSVKCEVCHGSRYSRDALQIKYKGKSIAEVLNMNVEEALEFFKHHKQIHRKIETLQRVGLDYMTLGQSSTTLSGGEAQRIKLSKELSKRGTGRTLYILDEPTTGLHFEDIRKLVELLHELADQGNTLIVIEHHLDVIKNADYIIDVGPEGGSAGGSVIFQGSPEELVRVQESHTGRFLKSKL
jgi:excinuclease ABC subunit A